MWRRRRISDASARTAVLPAPIEPVMISKDFVTAPCHSIMPRAGSWYDEVTLNAPHARPAPPCSTLRLRLVRLLFPNPPARANSLTLPKPSADSSPSHLSVFSHPRNQNAFRELRDDFLRPLIRPGRTHPIASSVLRYSPNAFTGHMTSRMPRSRTSAQDDTIGPYGQPLPRCDLNPP